ncbi:MAG: isopenicillin N synthase family oxygenase [Comamonadaceae bacterium]|nr:MAG: isopenicillin N synthase family oxygenase [Comamonadaceae bacterium]
MTLPLATLPVIDLSSPHTAGLARTLDQACRDIGFIVVRGHRVPAPVLQGAFDAGFSFFDAREAVRNSAVPPDDRVRGYTPLLRQQLAASLHKQTPPDLFERFRMGRFDIPDDDYHRSRAAGWFAPNVWPRDLPGFRHALEAYYRAMEALAGDLMQLFARALDLPPGYFDRSIGRHISSLCVNHYPALEGPALAGQLRAGEHTDYGSLTIVAPTAAPGRLQVLTREDGWVEVEPPPGHFVVNIGDLMAQWTNDRWVSTLHRVALPAPDAGPRARRLSLVFFHQPDDDALVECIPTCLAAGNTPRYSPITSGEHLRLKITRHFTQPA